jgi:hypothetical protein
MSTSKTYDMEIGSFIRFGMENAKHHWLKFFGAILGAVLFVVVLGAIAYRIDPNVGILVAFVAAISASFGFYANVIGLSSGKPFNFKAFLPAPMVFLNFLVGVVVCGIAVLIGLILLIVPGIIVGLALSLVPMLIIDQKLGFIDAIKKSIELTKGHKMDIFIGTFIANIVSSLLSIPVITLFFTIPMQAFVLVFPYVQLSGQNAPKDVPVPAAN